MVEIQTLLTVQALGIMPAHAVPMDHSFHFFTEALHWCTLAGMAIAEAVPAHHHVVNGIVVLLPDLHPRIQEVISQCVQLGELDS